MTSESVQPLVLRAQVAALYANSWSSTLTDALLASVFASLFYWKLRDPMVLGWAALYLVQFLRYPRILVAYRKDTNAEQRSDFWARKQWRELLIHSSVWGLAPWLFMPANDLPLTVLMILMILGLASGGVLAVAPRWHSVLSLVVPMVAGLTIALAWQGDDTHLFLAGGTTIYLGATLLFAYRQHKLLTHALQMRFENQALAEQLAQQVKVVQHLSAEKTRFFAAASHDLRQPLHAIALFGNVLAQNLADHPEHGNALRLMDSVNALSTSLDTMFDVSLLDSGVIQPEIQRTMLNPLFEQIQRLFASRAEQKGLQFRLRSSPLWVKTDPHLLMRILVNLVENAIKYTRTGGVRVVARARGQHVWIEVCDTGIGIATDQVDAIFEEFYQINNPGRDRTLGLGIGLPMIRRLCKMLDHPLSMKSSPEHGSRFRVQLPNAPSDV